MKIIARFRTGSISLSLAVAPAVNADKTDEGADKPVEKAGKPAQ